MIVDKVITKGQLFGRGKRARQFSILLDKAKKQREVKEKTRQFSDLKIDEVQNIYYEATEFYIKAYGNLQNIPQSILDSKTYKNLSSESVAKSLNLLGIQK